MVYAPSPLSYLTVHMHPATVGVMETETELHSTKITYLVTQGRGRATGAQHSIANYNRHGVAILREEVNLIGS